MQYYTVLIEKNPPICGPVQFKPMLSKYKMHLFFFFPFQVPSVYKFGCSFSQERNPTIFYSFERQRFMADITQQALLFAFQYMIENHCITLFLLFSIDCTLHVSLDYLQKLYSKCFIDLIISIIALRWWLYKWLKILL